MNRSIRKQKEITTPSGLIIPPPKHNRKARVIESGSDKVKVGDVVLVKQKVDGIETVRIKVYTGIATSKVEYQGKTLYDMFHDAGEYTERN